MKYNYVIKNTPFDFWQLSMYFTYGSIVGVCNVIFTIAMILLSVKIWGDTNSFIRLVLVVACALFPIIQPIGIYSRAKKQAESAKEIKIGFDNTGIHVESDNNVSDLEWKNIKKVSKKPNMIIIFSTTTHGFILNNKALGNQKREFYKFLTEKINR